MFAAGKYVRAPPATSEGDIEDSSSDEAGVGQFVRAPHVQDSNSEEDADDEDAACSTTGPDYQKQLEDRVLELENVIKRMSETIDATRAKDGENPVEVVSTPHIPFLAPSTSSSCTPPVTPHIPLSTPSTSGGAIRWDNIKPFPKDVAASKMWEAWTRFLEDFEMAASLSNVKDPERRVELLLLSMGDELKSIVRAAKLKPSVEEGTNYYTKFVGNIDQYLKAMTDPAAEHEDFVRMVQEEGESVVKFHARLTEKVVLCDYSPKDQDRFVRTQLLRGLRNQELKKAARTYSHDSNTIVQAGTRAEAFQAEMMLPRGESSALVVSSGKFQGNQSHIKRRQIFHRQERYPAKRFKSDTTPDYQFGTNVGRRYRCPRCFRPSHRGQECPALKKNCNSCGQRGHFAVACRVNRLNMVKDEGFAVPAKESREEQVKE